MRTRLTASYSVFSKIIIATLIFVGSFIFFVNIGVTVWFGKGTPVFAIVLFIASWLLVQFITKDRTVIEFDASDFYIVDATSKTEQKFRLENVIWLNLRPGMIKVSRWFVRYSLHYLDNYQQENKIRLWVSWTGKPLDEFVNAVKKKNPDFKYKGWTWTFDTKD